MKAPKEPKNGIEHDFRQMPTRITAAREGASWIVYEKRPNIPERRVLCFRPDWEDAYTYGTLLVRSLHGRTLEEGVTDGIITGLP